MSTRCTINFGTGKRIESKVYSHCDGSPDSVGQTLRKFFAAVRADTADVRFDDASMLAARFVVFLANQTACLQQAAAAWKPGTPLAVPARADRMLDFLSVRILMENPGDIEFEYFVDSAKRSKDGCPVVTYRCAGEDMDRRRPIPVAA
jgi:hypothetical protein